jgi:hypothetical protein
MRILCEMLGVEATGPQASATNEALSGGTPSDARPMAKRFDPRAAIARAQAAADDAWDKGEFTKRQFLGLLAVLEKMDDAGVTEVGMSERELADLTGMPRHACRRLLLSLIALGWLTRTTKPLMRVNQEAQQRHRARGRRGMYFYRLVERRAHSSARRGPELAKAPQ